MSGTMRRFVLAAGAAFAVSTGNAGAASFFFGEDLHNNPATPVPAFPNALAAEASFLAGIVGEGTENFEARSGSAPLALTFPGSSGNITATLAGGSGVVETVSAGSTNGSGRYGTSGANFWEVAAGGTGNFNVTFDQDVAAFGFFGVDIGDFGGQLTLEFRNDGALVFSETPNTTIGSVGSTDGTVMFFGAIANGAGEVFDRVDFLTTTGSGDVFAFDDFTVGDLQQVQNADVPLPAGLPMALAAFGLLGLAARRRRG